LIRQSVSCFFLCPSFFFLIFTLLAGQRAQWFGQTKCFANTFVSLLLCSAPTKCLAWSCTAFCSPFCLLLSVFLYLIWQSALLNPTESFALLSVLRSPFSLNRSDKVPFVFLPHLDPPCWSARTMIWSYNVISFFSLSVLDSPLLWLTRNQASRLSLNLMNTKIKKREHGNKSALTKTNEPKPLFANFRLSSRSCKIEVWIQGRVHLTDNVGWRWDRCWNCIAVVKRANQCFCFLFKTCRSMFKFP
jgi:hypothetical protein